MALGHRPGVQGSLLYFAGGGGRDHVSGIQDDPDACQRSATGADDEAHATDVFGDVRDFPVFERPGVVYSDQQSGGDCAAVVPQPDASPPSPGETRASEKVSAPPLLRGPAQVYLEIYDERVRKRWQA